MEILVVQLEYSVLGRAEIGNIFHYYVCILQAPPKPHPQTQLRKKRKKYKRNKTIVRESTM